jgi:hypothetical protein
VQWIAIAVIATALVALMPLRGMSFWSHLHVAFPSFITGWLIWIMIIIQIWRRLGSVNIWIRWPVRVCSLLLLALPLSWSVGTGSCSRGEFIYVGPKILSIATVGYECANWHAMHMIWDEPLGRRWGFLEVPSGRPEMEVQVLCVVAYVAFVYLAVRSCVRRRMLRSREQVA